MKLMSIPEIKSAESSAYRIKLHITADFMSLTCIRNSNGWEWIPVVLHKDPPWVPKKYNWCQPAVSYFENKTQTRKQTIDARL